MMTNWFDLLEVHFNKRKKAFLIFDESNILRYISAYAREILGIDESHIGFITLQELFLPSHKTPQLLIDKNYSFQSVQSIVYTTPAGLSKELRITKDTTVQTIGNVSGYVVWLEAKSRDITGVYKKVSPLDPFTNFAWLFEQSDVGFILLNNEGIIEKYNDKIKTFLTEPGDWKGQNIFTFPFIHQAGIDSLINQCMKGKTKPKPIDSMIKTPGYIGSFNVKWSGIPLKDLEGTLIGMILIASQIRDK
jgi:PAS domain-containing protein